MTTTAAYLTGGARAVLFGWRDSTVDVDLHIYRFPAIDPVGFRRRAQEAFGGGEAAG